MYYNAGKGFLIPQDIRKAGKFIVPNGITAGGFSTATIPADRYVWYPLIVGDHDLVVTHIGIAIKEPASEGKKGRAAIYSDSGNRVFAPNDLLYDCGEFAIDHTGFAGVDILSKFGEYIILPCNSIFWVAFALEEEVTCYGKYTTTLVSICVELSSIVSPRTAWLALRSFALGFPSNARDVVYLSSESGYMFVGVL